MQSDTDYGEKTLAFTIVIILSVLGGFIVDLLNGFKTPKIFCLPSKKVRPLLKVINIPPIIGMVIMGFIVRNLFGPIMDYYPSKWA